MRNKIMVNLNNSCERNIYDVINEKGDYKKIILSTEEINNLIVSGYFKFINDNNELAIDIYEEEIICDLKKINRVLIDTEIFKNSIIQNPNIINSINCILEILKFAFENKSCVYFIL